MEPTPVSSPDLVAGQQALDRGAWEEARRRFERALRAAECAEAHEGLAAACGMLADGAAAIAARERAYALYSERGERRAAARMAFGLALDSLEYRYEPAVANGWIRRANRLLEDGEPTPERGMLRLLEGHLALMGENDLETARARAQEGHAIARATGSRDVEVLSLGIEGLARVSEGDVAHGMRLLDEATAAALGGEVRDLMAVGQSCCYLIHACERVRDFERAGQWCGRVAEFCRRWRYTTMFTVCRTQYASVLMHRGDWPAAERELLAALDELRAHRPAAAAPGVVRLAELRRRQGRHDEAAALFESVRTHRMALLGRGELALDSGDPRAAGERAEQFLRRVPPESRTERVAGLDLLARAAAAEGDPARADRAAAELEAIAATIPTDPLRATALAARAAALAARDPHGARRALEDAAHLFERAAMPFEAARARLTLARTLADLGRGDEATRECGEAAAIFERLGAVADRAGAAALVARLAAPEAARRVPPCADGAMRAPAARDAGATSGLTAREVEVLRLVAGGLSDKEIAARLHLSPHTVHRHVSNVLLKLEVRSRAAAVAHATRLGMLG